MGTSGQGRGRELRLARPLLTDLQVRAVNRAIKGRTEGYTTAAVGLKTAGRLVSMSGQCWAEVAELADALDSKSSPVHPGWGFESPLRHSRWTDAAGPRWPSLEGTGT